MRPPTSPIRAEKINGLFLGDSDTHLGLLEAMYDEGLFNHTSPDPDLAQNNYYFVIGIRADAWDPDG